MSTHYYTDPEGDSLRVTSMLHVDRAASVVATTRDDSEYVRVDLTVEAARNLRDYLNTLDGVNEPAADAKSFCPDCMAHPTMCMCSPEPAADEDGPFYNPNTHQYEDAPPPADVPPSDGFEDWAYGVNAAPTADAVSRDELVSAFRRVGYNILADVIESGEMV